MSKTTVIYKDVAPGAAEDAEVITSANEAFTSPSLLPETNEQFRVATLEHNLWALDGSFSLLNGQPLAFWSTALSDENGAFSAPPVIKCECDEKYSSIGISFVFDPETGNYANSVNVAWYQDDTVVAQGDFTPDGTSFFCEQIAEGWNKVVITFNGTHLPHRRLKLNHIAFGLYRYYGMTDLRGAKIINEVNLLSLEIPVSTFDWTLDSHDDTQYLFQFRQPVEARNDNNLIGVYYINDHKRRSKNLYDISCIDAFGVLDYSPFVGGVYSGYSAKQLLTEILGDAFRLSFEVEDVALYGAILPGTKRMALQQIAFRLGAVVTTKDNGDVRVFSPDTAQSAIGKDRTYPGVSTSTDGVVTEVRVTAHTYTESENGTLEINGVKYTDTKQVFSVVNPDVTVNTKQNIKEVTNATLISPDIGQEIAERLYAYYCRRDTNKAKVVWRGEKLSDTVSVPNAWGGDCVGQLSKMTITLSNTVAADIETKGVV